jgi:hypothetical protein
MSRIAPGFIYRQLWKGSRALVPAPSRKSAELREARSPGLLKSS